MGAEQSGKNASPPKGEAVSSGQEKSGPVGQDPTLGPKDDFSRAVANLTHELKTPLHSILAVASVLNSEVDGPLNEEQQRQVEIITRNGEHLLELITGLLQFSSTTTQTRKLNIRQLDVSKLFEEILGSVKPVAAKTNVTVDADLERLEPHFCSDKTLLHRIFGNLLSNAVKFSPNGGAVSFFAETLKCRSLRVQVSDSGIGMSADQLNEIFQEFYQVDDGDTRRFGGVGLGLALVKSSLVLLGGQLDVKSEPEQGTLFTVQIPSADEAVEKRRILVLDEDPTICLTLRECFNMQGYETCFVESDRDVVRQIADIGPDLVMLDVKAPQMSSLAVLAAIRAASWGKDLPIILMSVLDGPEQRAKGFEMGASDFIAKPFDVTELLARVRSQLERPWE